MLSQLPVPAGESQPFPHPFLVNNPPEGVSGVGQTSGLPGPSGQDPAVQVRSGTGPLTYNVVTAGTYLLMLFTTFNIYVMNGLAFISIRFCYLCDLL